MNTSTEGKSAPVYVVPYDPAWPGKFESEAKEIGRILAPWVIGSIEHIGSTAIPGMVAKPVIDIMVAVKSLDASRPAIQVARQMSYIYWPYKADVMHWFCKPSDSHRTHHMHMVPYNSQLWKARLGFRDSLRIDKKLAAEYAQLKISLADKYRDDREAYTESKSEFVSRVLKGVGLV